MPFRCLKWPEMRGPTLDLIARLHGGHARGRFSIPAVDVVRVFALNATLPELERVRVRGDIHFIADEARRDGGTFSLPMGAPATFALGREGLSLRVPERMSGIYELRADGFRIEFKENEGLEVCKRILLLLTCNQIARLDVSSVRVDFHFPNQILDFCVEFDPI